MPAERIAPTNYDNTSGTLVVPPIFDLQQRQVLERTASQQQAGNSLVAEAYRDSVAFIKTNDGKNKDGTDATTGGSGFFVTRDGVLATDYHVIKDAKGGITVTTSDGVMHRATIKAVDTTTDLALLQVEPAVRGETFKAVKLAPSSDLKPNDTVFTRGHPHRSNESQIATGTNNARTPLNTFDLKGGLMPGENPYRPVITTAMSVETGNSGGPLVRESDGAVVAVVDFSGTAGDMTISTPVEDLHRLMARSGVTTDSQNMATRLAPLNVFVRPEVNPGTVRFIPRFAASEPQPGQAQSSLERFANIRTLPYRPAGRPAW